MSIENARQGVVSAQNSLDSAATDRPSTLAQQQAVIAGQDAVVRQAQQDVDETILRAPVDGTVSALNGAVGEYVAASSGTSALAPGSAAAIPGTGGASTEAAASAVARPGGTQFLVLDGIDTFQVVVPFEESDASRITAGQNVDVTFDAVPDLTRRGTVLAVAPAATASSGVIGYYVTVLLTETDPRLRDGQTAQAAVHTDELRDVLAVPNSAVHREGGQTTVTVVGPGGVQRRVPFQAGVVGDQPDAGRVRPDGGGRGRGRRPAVGRGPGCLNLGCSPSWPAAVSTVTIPAGEPRQARAAGSPSIVEPTMPSPASFGTSAHGNSARSQ